MWAVTALWMFLFRALTSAVMRRRRYPENSVNEFAGPFRFEGCGGHKSPEENNSEKGHGREFGIDVSWKVTNGDALGDKGDERSAGFELEAVMELPEV